MPVGLKFQRKHKFLGYKIKYIYYLFKRRDVLQKKKSYGEKNIDKTFYVIKPDYQDCVEGLLSLILKQVLYIDYSKRNNYIPIVDWKNFKTQYYDGNNNSWEYFFKQPSSIKLEEVYSSKNVYLSGWTFKNINSSGLFEKDIFTNNILAEKSFKLLKQNLCFTDEVLQMVDKEAKKIDIEKCIGVYIRGTDYVKLKPSGEYIQPDVYMVEKQISIFLTKYNAPIFLVTEDGEIYDELFNKYKDKIRIVSFDSFVRNYDGKDVLSKSNVLNIDRKKRGQNYLVKMILLSKCKYLISSITQGSKFSYSLNGGIYEDKFVFDLGLYD